LAQTKAGRPRRSSLDMLEEAAQELFLERGYVGTSVEDIATRAGVSRGTLFNYTGGKGDLLWVSADRVLGRFADALAGAPSTAPPLEAVQAAYVDTARTTGPESVPWAIAHADLMGTREQLAASGLSRLAPHAERIRAFLLRGGLPEEAARDAAFAFAGAAASAALRWIDAGVARHPLEDYLAPAIDPVVRGFGPVIPS
jgi:AcrR family transcriptional regulator